MVRSCEHSDFESNNTVTRLTDEAGTITGYILDVTVRCLECGEPFTFLGPSGFSFTAPLASIDGQTLHAPITPACARRSVIDQMVDAVSGRSLGES